MKRNLFLGIIFLLIICLSGCSGLLNEIIGFSSEIITIETSVISFETDDSKEYNLITWTLDSSVSYYKVYGDYASSIPSSVSTDISGKLESKDSFFDYTNPNQTKLMYYQVNGYNSTGILIAQSDIVSATKDFNDTILYTYNSTNDHPHKFTWQNADNISTYITKTSTNNSNWTTSDSTSTAVINWKIGSGSEIYIKVGFYTGSTYIYSKASTFTLTSTTTPTTINSLSAEVLSFETDDSKEYNLITWTPDSSVSYYKIYGDYASSTPSSVSTAISADLYSTDSLFDYVNVNGSTSMYYQVRGYNSSGTLISQSEIILATKDFNDTILYSYVSTAEYPHQFSWQDADNIVNYKTLRYTNLSSSWVEGTVYTTAGIILKSSATSLQIKVGFYTGSKYIYTKAKNFTLKTAATTRLLSTEVLYFETEDYDIYNLITWTQDSSVSYYKVYGDYASYTPSSVSTAISGNLYTNDSYFDYTNPNLTNQMYYQVRGYNSSGTLISQSDIISATSDFLDTIIYTYNSGEDYPHQFSWQDADNIVNYKTLRYTNLSSSWVEGTVYTTAGIILKSSATSLQIKVGFYTGSKYIYTKAKNFTLKTAATTRLLSTEVLYFETEDYDIYNLITWTQDSSVSYYKVYGDYASYTPSSVSTAISGNLYTNDSYFDYTNPNLTNQMYYQVRGYNSSGTLIAQSDIISATSDFLDTIIYTYNSGEDYPHHYSWQGADNITSYLTKASTNDSTWTTGVSDSIPETTWTFGTNTGIYLRFGFYANGDYIYSSSLYQSLYY